MQLSARLLYVGSGAEGLIPETEITINNRDEYGVSSLVQGVGSCQRAHSPMQFTTHCLVVDIILDIVAVANSRENERFYR